MKAQTHWLFALWKENIKGIKSCKSRIIYVKIKAEIDATGPPKAIKEI